MEKRLPFEIRNEAFQSLSEIPEERNFYVGYMRWPISGKDSSPILTPFWGIMGGTHHDAYTGRICKKLPKEFLNAGAFVKWAEGPNVFVQVPSQEKGGKPYLEKWSNVPFVKNYKLNKVMTWNTRVLYGKINSETNEFEEDEASQPLYVAYHVGYERKGREKESSDFSIIDQRGFAGHQEIIRYFMRHGIYEPEVLKYSQLAIPSREDALFWNKLNNNVLILEENESGNKNPKHPRVDQLSMIMSRRIGKYINQKDSYGQVTMFWHPERDGRIRDYPVLPGEE